MKKRCVELEKKNTEIDQHAKSVSNELSQFKDEFNILLDINSTFSNENEDLKRRIREYDENADDFDNNLRITKKVARNNDDESDIMDISSQELGETNEKEARVRNNNFCVFFSITNFYH